jgi:Zn-finger nucleic acid-binding protein
MCPDCAEPLVIIEFEGVEVDRCPGCRGTWLDAGELDLLGDLAGVPSGELERSLQTAPMIRRDRRRCPCCRRRMQVVRLSGDQPSEIDRCPRGDGLWLDRGELDGIIRSLAGGAHSGVARFFEERSSKTICT